MSKTLIHKIQTDNASHGSVRVYQNDPGFWLYITDDDGEESIWVTAEQMRGLVSALLSPPPVTPEDEQKDDDARSDQPQLRACESDPRGDDRGELECDQCGLKQSEWQLPIVEGAMCPRHYLDDDSCDGVILRIVK